ncbi:MAG: M20/M25/M40 family metallo-hydrolase [Chloroflexi bacterium]|nr:M20/M25/M40 family metallo-hydrolase [Chloroflexota bacterium]
MNRAKWLHVLLLAALLPTFAACAVRTQAPVATVSEEEITSQLDGQRLWELTRQLASAEFAGRRSGTEGGRLAAEFIRDRFREWGLQPAGDDGSYFQPFTFPLWQATPPVNLELVGGPSYTYGADYTLLSYSGSADLTAEVVFAGYGITIPPYDQGDYPSCAAPTSGYDDYAGLEVGGKIVLALRRGPRDDPNWHDVPCPITVADSLGPWAAGYKSRNAHQHGARGIIIVNNYRIEDELASITLTPSAFEMGIGAVFALRSIAEALVPDLAARQESIDATLTPAGSATGRSITMLINASFDPAARTENVLGAIPGTDPALRDEVAIVSAHYDHVGVDVTGQIFHGADDDASGTAAMMEIARVFSSAGFAPKRTLLFVGWAAEEEGLIGSSYYVDNPLYPLDKTVAVLQLDTVGVGNRSGVDVFGGTALPELFEVISANAAEQGVTARARRPSGASDHAPFFRADVPAVLISTTGPHPHIHTPADTIDTIDPFELEQSARIAAATAYELAVR